MKTSSTHQSRPYFGRFVITAMLLGALFGAAARVSAGPFVPA